MKKIITTFIATVLMIAMISPSVALAAFAGYGEDGREHSDVSYSDMEFVGYTGETMRATIEDMETKMRDAKNADAIVEDYKKIGDELDFFSTQYSLNNIIYYCDPLNEEVADLNLEMSALWTELADEALIAIREALKSPCGEALKAYIDNEELVQDYLDYEDMTERQLELNVLCDDLVNQYDISEQTYYTAEYNGEEWGENELTAAANAGTIDQATYNDLALKISQARNAVEADIYAQIVNAKNEIAKSEGYENYAECAYKDVYNRDYTIEEAKQLYSYVKKYIVPLLPQIAPYYSEAVNECYEELVSGYLMEDEALVDKIEPYVSMVHKDLAEAYDYMKKYHTYEMDYSEKKMQAGYTTSLYEYGCPFIFNCPSGSYYDVETLIHEFGHYNNAFHNDISILDDVTNMDVAEIHSQGLEMLMFEYYDGIYGTNTSDAVRYVTLYNMLNAVIEGCLYDEFQVEVFSHPGDITATECNKLFRKLAVEYGYKYGNNLDEAYDWIRVNHTFHQPLYYISYATSALAALDIFEMSTEDREKAVDLYMTLTTYGLSTPFCELLETVGLHDIFVEDTIKNVADTTMAYVEMLYNSKGKENTAEEKPEVQTVMPTPTKTLEEILTPENIEEAGKIVAGVAKVIVICSIAAVVLIAAGVVIVVLCVNKSKKKIAAAGGNASTSQGEEASTETNEEASTEVNEETDNHEEN